MAETTFGSDNHAGMAPEVLAALGEANVGHASGYGDDAWTERAEARLHDKLSTGVGGHINADEARDLAEGELARVLDRGTRRELGEEFPKSPNINVRFAIVKIKSFWCGQGVFVTLYAF